MIDFHNTTPITPYQFGATGNGTVDDTVALQMAMAEGVTTGQVLDLLGGIFKVTESLMIEGDIRIVNSDGAVIHAAAGSYANNAVINFLGSASLIGTLLADVSKGALTITSAGATSLKPGDLVSIFDPTMSSWSTWRGNYHAGEFMEIHHVADTTITLRGPLYDGYAAKNVGLYKINPIHGFINDIIVESDGSTNDAIFLDYGRNFRIRRPKARNANNTCIFVSRSFATTIELPDAENSGDGGDDYGITVSGQHTRIIGGDIFGRRHSVATGGASRVNDFVCRDLVVTAAVLRNDRESAVHCADFHGITENSAYIDCTIFGGASIAGKNNGYFDCRIHSMKNGSCIRGSEMVGGTHVMRGNTFYVHTDPHTGGPNGGVIDFGGASTNCITENTAEDLTIIVEDNTFEGSSLGSNTQMVALRNRGTKKKINIKVTNNHLNVNDFGYLLFMDIISGTANSDFIVVDGNKTALTDRPMMRNDGDYSVLPVLRLEQKT